MSAAFSISSPPSAKVTRKFSSRLRSLAGNRHRLGARHFPDTRFILVEGNYLLLDEAPWTRLGGCFDLTIFVGPPLEVLEERLRKRWVHYGLDESAIDWKLNGNDLPNGRRVIASSRPADISVDIVDL